MTSRQYIAAAVQLCSTEDIESNLNSTESQIRHAAKLGASLVAVPENFSFLRINADTPQPYVGLEHPIVQRMQALAQELNVHLILGSIPEPSKIEGKVHNASVYIDNGGKIVGVYRKMHLFDIDIPGSVTLKESDHITAGNEPVVVKAGLGAIGLSICYDLRFPEIYRAMTIAGARVLLCPAAFTLHTGKDHWLPLLRARAIENQAYVIAPGQFGKHGGKRHSYGKSTIIDPWGIPLAIAADGVGVAIGEVNYEQQDEIRKGLPCGDHRHSFFWPDKTE